jgi:hypothetical protein
MAAALAHLPVKAPAQTAAPGEAGAPYAGMNHIAPIGVRTGKYFDVPDAAKGPPVDPAKGYRVEELGPGLYMVTDNAISSMFMVCDKGVADVVQCMNTLEPKWKDRLAGYDVFIWDQCYVMEQSLRID